MTELETRIADNRAAIDEFVATARGVDPGKWAVPRAEGAWSPGQVVEHLALTYEYNRKVVLGTAEGLPFPLRLFLKPLLRRIVIDNTLKAGRFTRKGRAPAPFRPGPTPPPPADAIARLMKAVSGLEADLRSRPRSDTIEHPVFGTIRTVDWMQVQAIHARHHRSQLT
jgi:DinB family protein